MYKYFNSSIVGRKNLAFTVKVLPVVTGIVDSMYEHNSRYQLSSMVIHQMSKFNHYYDFKNDCLYC